MAGTIIELKNRTGISPELCHRALELCGLNLELAYEYIRLRSCAVSRRKNHIPYTDRDYLELAKHNINKAA